MRDLEFFLSLPWTIKREEHDDDGRYIALTIEELPGFVLASESEEELEAMFWPALRAFLQSYIQHGEQPPVPALARKRMAASSTPPTDPVREIEWRKGKPHVVIPHTFSVSRVETELAQIGA